MRPSRSSATGRTSRCSPPPGCPTATAARRPLAARRERRPMRAAVGLSEAEAAQVGGIGVPDYRGARAIQVSFAGEGEAPLRANSIRAGLAVPLLDSPNEPGMLA